MDVLPTCTIIEDSIYWSCLPCNIMPFKWSTIFLCNVYFFVINCYHLLKVYWLTIFLRLHIFPWKPLKKMYRWPRCSLLCRVKMLIYLLMCMIKVEGIWKISRLTPALVLTWQLCNLYFTYTIKCYDIVPVTKYKVIRS